MFGIEDGRFDNSRHSSEDIKLQGITAQLQLSISILSRSLQVIKGYCSVLKKTLFTKSKYHTSSQNETYQLWELIGSSGTRTDETRCVIVIN